MALRAGLRGSPNADGAFRALRLLQSSATQLRHLARASSATPPLPPPPAFFRLDAFPEASAQGSETAEPQLTTMESFLSKRGGTSQDQPDLGRAWASHGLPRGGLLLESDDSSPHSWHPGSDSSSLQSSWRHLSPSQWSHISFAHLSAMSAASQGPYASGTSAIGSAKPGAIHSGTGGAKSSSPFSTRTEAPQVRQLVIAACGPDRPGLVSALTKCILEKGGNVEQSRMARLAGEFSIIMLCSIDASVPRIAEDLKESLLKMKGLQVTTRWAADEKTQKKLPKKFRKIQLRGADNPGLVYNVTEYLAGNKINIENLETATEEAPFGGTTLFTMEGVIAMPANMPTETLVRSLEVLQDSLGVVIELQNMDPKRKAEDIEQWREQSQRVGGVSRYSILAQSEAEVAKGDKLI